MTEQEEYTEAALHWLQQDHIHAKAAGLSDAEIVEIAKTNGDIDQDAMNAYCDFYNQPRPVRTTPAETKMFGGPIGF